MSILFNVVLSIHHVFSTPCLQYTMPSVQHAFSTACCTGHWTVPCLQNICTQVMNVKICQNDMPSSSACPTRTVTIHICLVRLTQVKFYRCAWTQSMPWSLRSYRPFFYFELLWLHMWHKADWRQTYLWITAKELSDSRGDSKTTREIISHVRSSIVKKALLQILIYDGKFVKSAAQQKTPATTTTT